MTNSGDEGVKFADLSGLAVETGENPFAAFIEACNNNSSRIQEAYQSHRTARNTVQKAQFLSPTFQKLSIDPILSRLENPQLHPGYQDPRNCLVLWARPPDHVLRLAAEIQGRLKAVAPNIWLLPTHRMHMTALEIAFSKTAEEITTSVDLLRPHLPSLVSITYTHRARLVRPMVSYDVSAFALSFVPATPDKVSAAAGNEEGVEGDSYTYHHLRRDVFDAVKKTGIETESRYQVPSAHITLGRFLVQDDHATHEDRERWIRAVEGVNLWLERKVWTLEEGAPFWGEWVVGQEKGLEARCGTLWYGGGRTVLAGEGF